MLCALLLFSLYLYYSWNLSLAPHECCFPTETQNYQKFTICTFWASEKCYSVEMHTNIHPFFEPRVVSTTHTHIVGGSHRVLVVVFLLLTMHRNAPVKSTSCNIEKVNNFNWHSHTLSHKFCQALVRHFSYHLIKREKNKQKQQQQPH